jgi:hypothetical protein
MLLRYHQNVRGVRPDIRTWLADAPLTPLDLDAVKRELRTREVYLLRPFGTGYTMAELEEHFRTEPADPMVRLRLREDP